MASIKPVVESDIASLTIDPEPDSPDAIPALNSMLTESLERSAKLVSNMPIYLPMMKGVISAEQAIDPAVQAPTQSFIDTFSPLTDVVTQFDLVHRYCQRSLSVPSGMTLSQAIASCHAAVTLSFDKSDAAVVYGRNVLKSYAYTTFVSASQPSFVSSIMDKTKSWS